MGEQAIKIPLDQIRRLADLPADVVVVKVLSPFEDRTDWIFNGDKPPLYLHIRHPFCSPAVNGHWLHHEHLDSFLRRYREMEHLGADKS